VTRWHRDSFYAYRRGRRPLQLVVSQSTGGWWRGSLEWWCCPSSKESCRIPITGRHDTHLDAIKAAEKAFRDRFRESVTALNLSLAHKVSRRRQHGTR